MDQTYMWRPESTLDGRRGLRGVYSGRTTLRNELPRGVLLHLPRGYPSHGCLEHEQTRQSHLTITEPQTQGKQYAVSIPANQYCRF